MIEQKYKPGTKIIVKQSCGIEDLRGKLCEIIERPLNANNYYITIKDKYDLYWYIKEDDFDIEYIKKLDLL